MKIKGSMIMNAPTGGKALVLLTEDKTTFDKLYHKLSIDAYQFKKEIAENIKDIKYITAGYKTDKNEVIWNDDYIPVPRWYELN